MGKSEDDELLGRLAAAVRNELTPPPSLLDAARASFTWRTVDAELAELTHDSLVDASAGLARAEDGEPRLLTFEATQAPGSAVIEMEVDQTAGARRVVGHVEPAGPAELQVRSGELGGAQAVVAAATADALGRFALPLPTVASLVSLRCRFPDGTTVETARLRL